MQLPSARVCNVFVNLYQLHVTSTVEQIICIPSYTSMMIAAKPTKYIVQHAVYLLCTVANCWPVSKQHTNMAHFMLALGQASLTRTLKTLSQNRLL